MSALQMFCHDCDAFQGQPGLPLDSPHPYRPQYLACHVIMVDHCLLAKYHHHCGLKLTSLSLLEVSNIWGDTFSSMCIGYHNFTTTLSHVTLYIRACCHEAIFSKTLAWVIFWCLFMYKNGTKFLKNLGRRFHDWKLV